MKKTSALLILCLCGLSILAQDTTCDFEFTIPKYKPKKSLYKAMEFLDSRSDTSCIGSLEYGSNGYVNMRLRLEKPVQPQLDFIMQAHTGEDAGDGRLLLQLRRFSFSEKTAAKYCYLDVVLYARNNDRYTKLLAMDTTVVITADVRSRHFLTEEINRLLDEFIVGALPMRATESASYSLEEVAKMDSIEKQGIPLYNAANFTEGFYSDYGAFMRQQPDLKGDVRTAKDGSIASLKIHDARWVGPGQQSHIYAVVYKGVPYIVTHFGFWPLKRTGDEFYFSGKLKVAASNAKKVGMQVAFGEIGAALASDARYYRVLVDHANGTFIHLEELEKL